MSMRDLTHLFKFLKTPFSSLLWPDTQRQMKSRIRPKVTSKQPPCVHKLHSVCVFELDTDAFYQPRFYLTALPLYNIIIFFFFLLCTGFIIFRGEILEQCFSDSVSVYIHT